MFSIVIVNWNGGKYIKNCLSSIENQNYKVFKVYMVDNGSTDDSINIIGDFQEKIDITLIRLDKNYGFAYANNIGIEESMKDENDFVVTLNNDLELNSDCLYKLKTHINNQSDCNIFQILLMNFYERDLIDAMGICFRKDLQVKQLAYKEHKEKLDLFRDKVMGASAGAAAYSKKALLDTKDRNGYFDNDFFAYYEDADLAVRMIRKGYKTALAEEAIAFHVHSGTGIQDSPFKTYYLTRNLLLMLYKNRDLSGYNRSKFRYYLYYLKIALNYLFKGKLDHMSATMRGLRDFFKMKSEYRDFIFKE